MLKISKIVNISYFLVSFALNSPLGYELHITSVNNKTICFVKQKDSISVTTDQIVNGIFSNVFVPFIILFFTTAIAVLLFRAKIRRNCLSQKMTSQENKDL